MADKKRHWLSRLSFGSVSAAGAILLVLGYLSVFMNPAKAWFFTLFGLLYPLVFLLTLALFVWSLLRRSRMRLLLALALLPSFFFLGRYIQLGAAPEDRPEPGLKVISYNVGLFAHGPEGMSRLELADSVSRYLRAQKADVICLQEFYLPSNVPTNLWFLAHFPGYHKEYYLYTGEKGSAGNVTLTRRRVLNKGKIVFEKSTNMALWTDVRFDSGTLRLYNCHFESYNISLPALVKGFTDDEVVEETGRKMSRSIRKRPRQVNEVLDHVDTAPVPSLVLGDFNDTPLSYTYFHLLRDRKDSFTQAGRGLGATHSALWPLLRIDYILYPEQLQAVSYQVDRVPYSDHYPIIAGYYETRRDSH